MHLILLSAMQVLFMFNSLKLHGGFKGHLSDDEMVETPMPGRVRKVIRHKRQQKAAQVSLFFLPEVSVSFSSYRARKRLSSLAALKYLVVSGAPLTVPVGSIASQ